MLQINSAIGSFTCFSVGTNADCELGMLPAVPCLMILILPVPICSTSITLRKNGISLLYLPRLVLKHSRVSKLLGPSLRKRESGRLTQCHGITARLRRYIDGRDRLSR